MPLCPGRGVFGMRVGYSTDFRKCLVEDKVGWEVRGGFRITFHDLAMEICDNKVLGLHRLVRYATGLNCNQLVLAGKTAGIPEGI